MSETYRFDSAQVHAVERRLLVDGAEAAVGSRAFDVLLALIRHRDRVVTKDELLEMAWPGLVVEENNLQAQVSALRRVLGPRCIVTVPGRGYRFAAECHPGSHPSPAAEPATTARPLPNVAELHGRDADLAELRSLLPGHRLVTVLGPAGIGKTTLALAAARDSAHTRRDGVVWVELASVRNGEGVPAAVAHALDAELQHDEAFLALRAALKGLDALVVLDNAEHLAEDVARLAQSVLTNTTGVSILVTSQAALKLPLERVYRLGPLEVPPPGTPVDAAAATGAVALFVERARSADGRFALTAENVEAVSDVCRRLDGIALAIELAAARVPLLGVEGLATRLDERLRLLTAGSPAAPTRQQTLNAALDWSYGLLDAEEQATYRRLGVFAGGFALEPAIAAARSEGEEEWRVLERLGRLVDRSLIEAQGTASPRYRMLESARAHALSRLRAADGELAPAERGHARAMAARCDEAFETYWTLPEADWRSRYACELDNVRAALDWGAVHEPALAVHLLGSSFAIFQAGSAMQEYRRQSEAREPHVPATGASALRYWLARSEALRGLKFDLRRIFALRAAALARDLGDDRSLYRSLVIAVDSPPFSEAPRLVEEMKRIERPDWPPRLLCLGANAEGSVHAREGRLDLARAAKLRALELARRGKADRQIFAGLSNVADMELAEGRTAEAVRLGRELLAGRIVAVGNNLLLALANLANALLQNGEPEEARKTLATFLGHSRALGWEAFDVFADVLALLPAVEGRFEDAALLAGHAEAATARIGGMREINEARARELSLAAVTARLAPATLQALLAQGAILDPESACAIALREP